MSEPKTFVEWSFGGRRAQPGDAWKAGRRAGLEEAAKLSEEGDYACGYDGFGECKEPSEDIRALKDKT